MKNIIIVLLVLIVISCTNKVSREHLVLNATLDETSVSLFDIFESVKVIPLQVNEKSLFKYADKIQVLDDTIYLFDKSLGAILKFDLNGNFIDKIHHIGRGNGEYIYAYDFALDSDKRTISILDPTGFIHIYDLYGNFVETLKLPKPPYSYICLETINYGEYVLWSRVDSESEYAVNIFSKDNDEFKISSFHHSGLWGTFLYGSVFYKYDDKLFYYETLSNKVYCLENGIFTVAYEWNLGVKPIDNKLLKSPIESITQAQDRLVKAFTDGKIPLIFARQAQTKKYFLTTLIDNQFASKNIIFDKNTKESIVFGKTKENIELNFDYICDEFTIGFVKTDNIDTLKKISSSKDFNETEYLLLLMKFKQ